MVFPEASGPKISITLPLGTPPRPRAASRASEPVEMTGISNTAPSCPILIIEPLPKCFSIWDIARSTDFPFSDSIAIIIPPFTKA